MWVCSVGMCVCVLGLCPGRDDCSVPEKRGIVETGNFNLASHHDSNSGIHTLSQGGTHQFNASTLHFISCGELGCLSCVTVGKASRWMDGGREKEKWGMKMESWRVETWDVGEKQTDGWREGEREGEGGGEECPGQLRTKITPIFPANKSSATTDESVCLCVPVEMRAFIVCASHRVCPPTRRRRLAPPADDSENHCCFEVNICSVQCSVCLLLVFC